MRRLFPALLFFGCSHPAAETPVKRAMAFFETRPVYERPLADGFARPPQLKSISAASCGECHADIYAEWAVSTHAHAWRDPQLQAEMKKSDNRWMCRNCHTPLLVQHAEYPVALEGGDVEKPVLVAAEAPDLNLREEGITCAACHLRDGVIVGPTGRGGEAHATRADPSFRSPALCLRCHQAVAEYPGKTFVCTFRTGEEWAAGAFGQGNVPCQACHMPEIVRAPAKDAPVRATRRHWWAGGGLPKHPGVYPPPEALPPGLTVEAKLEGAELALTLINATAGHMLPTGDPERFLTVEAIFVGADGSERGRHLERIGQVWKWWPAPVKEADTRLLPQGQRTVRVQLPAGTARVRVVATRHRMTPENAKYNGLDPAVYPISAPLFERELVVP